MAVVLNNVRELNDQKWDKVCDVLSNINDIMVSNEDTHLYNEVIINPTNFIQNVTIHSSLENVTRIKSESIL